MARGPWVAHPCTTVYKAFTTKHIKQLYRYTEPETVTAMGHRAFWKFLRQSKLKPASVLNLRLSTMVPLALLQVFN